MTTRPCSARRPSSARRSSHPRPCAGWIAALTGPGVLLRPPALGMRQGLPGAPPAARRGGSGARSAGHRPPQASPRRGPTRAGPSSSGTNSSKDSERDSAITRLPRDDGAQYATGCPRTAPRLLAILGTCPGRLKFMRTVLFALLLGTRARRAHAGRRRRASTTDLADRAAGAAARGHRATAAAQ